VARSALSAARSSLPASHGAAFSTSATKFSGASDMSSAPREYDPEIKDIADYVANKTIDSELAVSTRSLNFTPRNTPPCASTPENHHDTMASIDHQQIY
jgi:hypothetical protein